MRPRVEEVVEGVRVGTAVVLEVETVEVEGVRRAVFIALWYCDDDAEVEGCGPFRGTPENGEDILCCPDNE